MKENTQVEDCKTWTAVFNKLPMYMKLKTRDVSLSLLNITYDIASNLTYTLSLMLDKNRTLNPTELETDLEFCDWFAEFRRSIIQLKANTKGMCEKLVKKYTPDAAAGVAELFGPKKDRFVMNTWGIEDARHLRNRFEDLFLSVMPQSYKQEVIPDDKSTDFKVHRYSQPDSVDSLGG
jgi:hypothetical protein